MSERKQNRQQSRVVLYTRKTTALRYCSWVTLGQRRRRCHMLRKTVPNSSGCYWKERSPIVDCTVFCTTSAVVAAERSRCRDSTSGTRWRSLVRYGGAIPCWQRYTSITSRNTIRSGIRSQCRSLQWSHVVVFPRPLKPSRGGIQRRLCILSNRRAGSPAIIPLP